ncbi:MAG: hypothetical protein CMM27_14760 [Rhodospirillaceae bacterium]|nr:hypothetical protein [Rhodospirillaceae bacterium]
MAIIYSYPAESSPQPGDLILGTSTATVDGKQTNVTRTYTMQVITDYIKSLGGIGVESITFSAPLTGGTITLSGTVGIPKSDATTDGYLSSTDWSIFNNKIGGISGSTDSLPVFTSAVTLGNSSIAEPSGGTTVTSTKNFVASGAVDLGLTGTRWNAIYRTTTNTTALVVGTSLNANGDEGTAGQVLTSGGPGTAMTWTSTSSFGDLYNIETQSKVTGPPDYIPVVLVGAGSADSTIQFTEGTGITLTEGGASPTSTLTIAANTAAVTNGATTTLATGDDIYDFTVALPLNTFAAATGDIDAGSQKIINLGTPVAGTDATTKTYVDSAVANAGTFQGGYNASTDSPCLDGTGGGGCTPSTSIQNGWFWAVQTGGTFFSVTVQPGDLIFANTDNPGTTEGNWTVIESGHDTATATTLGVAKFPTGNNGLDITAGAVTAQVFSGSNLTGGYVPDASAETGDKFLKRDGTWAAGPVTNVSSITIDAGLTGLSNPITSTGNIGPDYTGAANIILSSTDGSGVTLTGSESFIFSDDADSNKVKYAALSKIKTYVGANPGTGTQYSIPLWATTGTLGDSTLTQDATATKVSIANGVDLEFGALSDLVTANGAASAGLYLKSKGVGAGWEWDSPGGGVSSVDKATGSASTGDPITIGGTGSGPYTGAITVAANTFAGDSKPGVVTATASDASNFLRGDGQWAAAGGGSLVKDEFTATASQTAFTVSQAPTDINYVSVYVAGVYQTKSAIASVVGTTVTLASGVPVGTKVEMVTSY